MKQIISILILFSLLTTNIQAGAFSKAWKKVRREAKVSYYRIQGDKKHAKKIRQQEKYKNLTIHREDIGSDLKKIGKAINTVSPFIPLGGIQTIGTGATILGEKLEKDKK